LLDVRFFTRYRPDGGHAARSAIPAIAAVMVSVAVDREVSSNADMYNGSSPSRPSGIDYNGDAVHGVGIAKSISDLAATR